MRETTMRNQIRATEPTATGQDDAAADSSPVAPSDNADAEVADTSDTEYASDNQEADAQYDDTVSTGSNDSSADELIDFIEFAETNPNAKFKFMKNGKEVVIDAKKAAAILGQGSAIHEEARQLKVDKAEFEEYLNDVRSRQEGLTLAMEFTVQPKLQKAYDEILKTQSYQTTFQQQLAQTRDPAQIARIQAGMQQNEQYIRQQQQVIGQLKPAVDQFRQVRAQQVVERLDHARKNFTDKELKNEFVFNEVRDKIAKLWPEARGEIIPGVANIDLLSSDEGLLSLVRDGLRYRDKPAAKSAGNSMAALTSRKGSSTQRGSGDSDISKLREQAKGGDKKAADNLLVAQLQRLRQSRGSR
jgi:predicted acetyltransferase